MFDGCGGQASLSSPCWVDGHTRLLRLDGMALSLVDTLGMKNREVGKGLCSGLEGILAGVRLVFHRGLTHLRYQLNPAAGLASWQLWFRAMSWVMGLGPHFF